MPQEKRPNPRQRRAEFDEKIGRLAELLQEIADAEPTVEERSVHTRDGGTRPVMSYTVPQALLNALEHIGYFKEHPVQFHLMPCATGNGGAFMRVVDIERGGRRDGGGIGELPSVKWINWNNQLPAKYDGVDPQDLIRRPPPDPGTPGGGPADGLA